MCRKRSIHTSGRRSGRTEKVFCRIQRKVRLDRRHTMSIDLWVESPNWSDILWWSCTLLWDRQSQCRRRSDLRRGLKIWRKWSAISSNSNIQWGLWGNLSYRQLRWGRQWDSRFNTTDWLRGNRGRCRIRLGLRLQLAEWSRGRSIVWWLIARGPLKS